MEVINGHKCFFIHRINNEGADTVIFMNGVLNSSFSWTEEAKLAKSLGLNTLRYDFRGQWDSERTPGPYTMELLAEDLAALMDHLQIESAHLLGISFGCFISQKFSAMYPDRVKSLLMMNTTPVIRARQRFILETWCKLNEMAEDDLYFDMMSATIFSDKFFEENIETFEESRKMLHIGLERVPDLSKGQYLLNKASMDNLAGDGLLPDLPKIKCPTHVVTSEFDDLYHPKYSEMLAEKIEGAQLTVVPGVGHTITREAPEVANRLIMEHLEKYAL